MSETFGSDFFASNRERLRQLFTGTAPIVITAGGRLQRAGDEPYPFHQDRNFWYLTGVDEPDVVLVMDKGREYLIVPEREAVRVAFDGAVNNEYLTRTSGIKEIMSGKEGWKLLESRLKRVQHVATLSASPKYFETFGIYTNPARRELIRRMKRAHPGIELLDLRKHLAKMRMVKQPAEVEAIQQAIDTTIDTLKEVTKPAKLTSYAHEFELEADIFRGFRRRGSEGHAFTPIIAGGPRATALHYDANSEALSSDELVVVDVGASARHYAADITRTICLNGKPSRRQQQVHEAVCQVQDYAISLLKPGTQLRDYEKAIEYYMGEKLRELGLIQSISTEAVRRFFPHATSHFLGLDTHDAGDYDEPLKPGMVLTVEPGIYISEEGLGVRIEDDVLITDESCDVLSKKLPRDL